jgi:methylenetetrahydrofolate dehydrogenase (NADP+)/methenyltetrahydrofolate cyclohydrolase
MEARILDGKKIAQAIRLETTQRIADWRASGGATPCLAAVLVGDNPASAVYVRNKQKACEAVGIKSRLLRLSDRDGQEKLLETVEALNSDPEVHGILVQLPLPKGYQETLVLDRVHPLKDVDAFCPENVGLLIQGRPRFLPCTPHGVIQLLAREGLTVVGKQAIVIGRSDIVGKPLAMLLAGREGPCGENYANGTVILAHSRTEGLGELTRTADLVFAAVGRAELVRQSWIKPGAVVIDVGINRVGDRLVGDVHFEECRQVASAITPVPGGIGPLTIAMLLENTLKAAQLLGSTYIRN